MAYTPEQQQVILDLRGSSPSLVLDLPDYQASEPVAAGTFNQRLFLLEALFTDLQDQIRNVSVNLSAAALILNGLPRTALANDVQISLARADFLYPILTGGGINRAGLAPEVNQALDLAETAYQRPPGGIPETDLAPSVTNKIWHRRRFVQTGSLTTSITFVGTPFPVGTNALTVTIDGQVQDEEITYTEDLDGLGITLSLALDLDQILVLKWYGAP
jgi:hypothetical protein